jgi:L-methionine (R)-S-oxide reductase
MTLLSLENEIISLIEDEKNLIANLANISASIYHGFPGLNWCGFYLWSKEDQELILGPFQGKAACIRIKSGKGVCGTSYLKGETLRVDDVHEFPGHISCDSASESELVVPMIKNGEVLGVLDLDAPVRSHFSAEHALAFTQMINRAVPYLWRD